MSYQTDFEEYLDQYIKENHEQLITGPVLNAVFKELLSKISWKDDQYFKYEPILIESSDISNNEYIFNHNFNDYSPGIILYDKNGAEVGPANFKRTRNDSNNTKISCISSLAPYVGMGFSFSGSAPPPEWETLIDEDFSSWGGTWPNETLENFNILDYYGGDPTEDLYLTNDNDRGKFFGYSSEVNSLNLNTKLTLEEGVTYRLSLYNISGYNSTLIIRFNWNQSTHKYSDFIAFPSAPSSINNVNFVGIAGRVISVQFYSWEDDSYNIIDNFKLEKFNG